MCWGIWNWPVQTSKVYLRFRPLFLGVCQTCLPGYPKGVTNSAYKTEFSLHSYIHPIPWLLLLIPFISWVSEFIYFPPLSQLYKTKSVEISAEVAKFLIFFAFISQCSTQALSPFLRPLSYPVKWLDTPTSRCLWCIYLFLLSTKYYSNCNYLCTSVSSTGLWTPMSSQWH